MRQAGLQRIIGGDACWLMGTGKPMAPSWHLVRLGEGALLLL